MNNQNDDLLLLESMIGTAVSRTAGLQVAVDKNLPLPFPKGIHYELYKNHIELHIESSTYKSLCAFLERVLPNNEIARTEKRGFCEYAYILSRRIRECHYRTA